MWRFRLLNSLLHHFLVDYCNHQSWGTAWLRTRGTTTYVGSSTPRPSQLTEWVVHERNSFPFCPVRPWISYLLFVKRELNQEDNTWWQSVGNIYFYSCHTESLQSSTRGKPFSPPSTTSRISKPGYRYRRLILIAFVWICCILLDRWLTRSRSSWLQLRWPSRTYRWRSNQFWWWWSLVIDVLRNTIGSGGEAWLCDQVEWSKDSTDGAARQHWNHSQPGDHPAVRHWCVWPTLPFAGSHWDCPGLLARALWGQSAKQTWKQAKALLQGIPNSSKYLSTVFYQDLLKKSGDALKRNRQFIKKDQEAYQNQLEKSYHTCMEYLKPLLRCS